MFYVCSSSLAPLIFLPQVFTYFRHFPHLALGARGLPALFAAVDEAGGLVNGGRHVEALDHAGPLVDQHPSLAAVVAFQLFA